MAKKISNAERKAALELFLSDRANIKCRNKFVEMNMSLIYMVIRRHHYGVAHFEEQDLVQEGVIGLINAAETYDQTKGEFATHAAYKIRSAITNFLGKENASNRMTSQRKGRSSAKDDEQTHRIRSMNDHISADDDNTELGDTVISNEKTAQEILEEKTYNTAVFNEIKNFLDEQKDSRIAVIIKDRHLLEEEIPYANIGKKFGISLQAVHLIHTKTLAKLRERIAKYG